MTRILLEIAFDGTDYTGWQSQSAGTAVQDALEKRLRILYNVPVRLHASSRTDSGVHALALNAHFTPPETVRIPEPALHQALNRLLPSDIRVRTLKTVEEPFHARFSAVAKTYCYVMSLQPPMPHHQRYVWHTPLIQDISAMRHAVDCLKGTHSFQPLCCTGTSVVTDYNRTLYTAELHQFHHFLVITLTGDGFLYKMVRSIVGLLEDIGVGRCPPDTMEKVLSESVRTGIVKTAPPQGLFLVKVHYELCNWEETVQKQPPFLNFF